MDARLRNGTWTHERICQAVEALEAEGVLRRIVPKTSPQDVTGLLQWNPDATAWHQRAYIARGVSAAPGTRKVAVASFFDGIGSTRLGCGDAMRMLGCAADFHSSVLIEVNMDLANRVAQCWDPARHGGHRCADGGPPHVILGADVWDVFQPRHGPARPDGARILQ